VCIDAAHDRVWDQLARLEDIQLWSEAIVHARCPPDRAQGIGAERTCRLTGGLVVRERFVAWDEGRSLTYVGSGIPLVARAWNTWAVRPENGQSLVTSEARVELKAGWLGRLLEPLVARQIQRTAGRSLAAFRYLVEHGEPPRVPHARLAPAPSVC